MDLKYLSNVHTGRHTQRVQNNIKGTSVGKIGHILHRKHTGNNTLITMTTGHFITNGNLSLLRNIDTDCLVNAG